MTTNFEEKDTFQKTFMKNLNEEFDNLVKMKREKLNSGGLFEIIF